MKKLAMRITPIILVVAVLGCGSGTQPAKPGGNQAKATTAKVPDTAAVKKQMTREQLDLGGPIANSMGMLLVPIPAGEFQMGSPSSDKAAMSTEKPQHLVRITKPFYLSVYVVTEQQYEKVMGTRPWQDEGQSKPGRPDYPASYVTWSDSVKFCRKLSEMESVQYRLPSEAQWEYACRAGTTTAYSFGDDASKLGQYAWYRKNTWDIGEKYPHRVGQKLPNPWGLLRGSNQDIGGAFGSRHHGIQHGRDRYPSSSFDPYCV